MRALLFILAACIATVVANASTPRCDQSRLVPVLNAGAKVLQFDWPTPQIGTGEYEEGPTGVTVIRFGKRVHGAVAFPEKLMSAVMDEFPRRHRITVEAYHRMAELGFFAPDARVELIEGEIIDMPPIGPRHGATVSLLHELLIRTVSDRVFAWGPSGVQLGDFSEPQPDLALLPRRADCYSKKNPTSADTLLIIEVSESTLSYDQRVKLPLYARYGIPEYRIVDTQKRQILVARNPTPAGYQQTFVADRPEAMPILALPAVGLDVSSAIAL